jgi:hypothetical protein
MEEVEFAIESLAIKIYTNIPDKQNQIVNFTRSMLYIPKSTNEEEEGERENVILAEIPFFTIDIEYPVDKLNRLDYHERVNFFFNAGKFAEMLRPYFVKEENQPAGESSDANDNYYDNRERRTRRNVMTMLEILFPTKFPVINDIHASYDFLKEKQSTRAFWFNPFQTHYFSYLKIGGGTYTIKKTVWLNDMLNHPVYRKMIVEYRKVRKWADEELYSKESKFGKPAEQIKEIDGKIKIKIDEMKKTIEELNNIAMTATGKGKTKDFEILYNLLKSVNESSLANDKTVKQIVEHGWISSDTSMLIVTQPTIITDKVNPLKAQLRDAAKLVSKHLAKKQEIKDNLANVNAYFTTALTRVRATNQISPILRKFQAIMNDYKDPFRKSSNIYLQQLIDGLFTNDDIAAKYYKLLDAIYEKYIRGESINDDAEAVLTNGTDEPKLVNVGISYINIGESNKPTREVYFMIDLVDGEINNENVSSIYCPFIGDYLGNQLEYLISESRNTVENKWAVDKNRQMFSLKKIEASIANNFSNNQMSASESIPSRKIGPGQLSDNRMQPTRPIVSPVQNFMAYIMKDPTELQKQLDVLKTKYLDNDITSLDAFKILDQIRDMKQNSIAKQLYEAIEGWNENIEIKNHKVINMLITIINNIKARKEIIADAADSYQVKNDPSGQKLLVLNKEKDINNVLASIAENVLAHEKTKREKITGGTKKHINRDHHHKKNTRRHR